MRRLFFLRHAKAEPGASDQDDHDRALTDRGVADAAAVAHYLVRQDYRADRILCSTALRTRQTAAAVLERIAAPIVFVPELYLASPGRLLSLAQSADDAVQALMLVGHNPGLEQCVALLARDPVQPRELAHHELLEEKFPTAALAVLDFTLDSWRKLSPCSGRLADFVRPGDIQGL